VSAPVAVPVFNGLGRIKLRRRVFAAVAVAVAGADAATAVLDSEKLSSLCCCVTGILDKIWLPRCNRVSTCCRTGAAPSRSRSRTGILRWGRRLFLRSAVLVLVLALVSADPSPSPSVVLVVAGRPAVDFVIVSKILQPIAT
jgi:hypothetical protein